MSDRADARLVNVVTLRCKDAERARQCLAALESTARPDALAYRCASYEFGFAEGSDDTIVIVEHWHRWEDLDALALEKVVPALEAWNELLASPFDPARDTRRIRLQG